ncbi:MAG: 3-dehydroquinate synthase [Anaerolineae bacterium]|nr:3-dehydroquinate synthase [Anaerolineae bacterium]
MASEPLTIQGAEYAYPVVVRDGALMEALPAFVKAQGFARMAVITNTTVGPLYGAALVDRLPGAFLITVDDGEQYKTLDTLRSMYTALLEQGADRSTLVVALGGGVVGDMAGFAAATFMRGVALVQAPTSLLAMVDASLGGKVGVDLPQGKNLAGAFKDPLAVFADTSALITLQPDEFRSGMAEIIKAGLIADPALVERLLTRGADGIGEIITRAVLVKKHIVEQDRLEGGIRAVLNLGHTFGHAIEHASGYAWKHGEAVAVGMVAAVRLSAQRGLCAPELVNMVERVLRYMGLPLRYADLDPAELWDVMGHDKKWHGGTARFVLLKAIGEPVIVDGVTRDEVIAVLSELREDAA